MPEMAHAQMLSIDSRAITGLMGLMGIVFTVLAALVTGNAVRLSVTERSGELATLRAIGYRAGLVAYTIILEAVLICVGGAVFGALLVVAFIHRAEFGGFWLSDVAVKPEHALAGVGFGLAVAVLAGLGPALYGARTSLSELMRGA
jgi:putative ABC transport system permease protein